MSPRPRKPRGPNTGRSITTARGYGNQHQKLRAHIKLVVDAGQAICVRCGERILPHQVWDLDHRDDRRSWLGPSHRACNQAARNHKPHPPAKALSIFFNTSKH